MRTFAMSIGRRIRPARTPFKKWSARSFIFRLHQIIKKRTAMGNPVPRKYSDDVAVFYPWPERRADAGKTPG